MVRDVIARHGMPNGGLELEITESALQAVDRSRPLLLALRQLGVQLAIDDFGTGFSSLSLLQHLPIDRLKIDRSFIAALSERSSSLAIVRAVVGLGHTLGLRVVAEGVETTQQLALLRHTGCEDAQGYYVCHPLAGGQSSRPGCGGGGCRCWRGVLTAPLPRRSTGETVRDQRLQMPLRRAHEERGRAQRGHAELIPQAAAQAIERRDVRRQTRRDVDVGVGVVGHEFGQSGRNEGARSCGSTRTACRAA